MIITDITCILKTIVFILSFKSEDEQHRVTKKAMIL